MSAGDSRAPRVPPPSRLPLVVTTPLSWLYHLGIDHANRRYDAGRGVAKLDRPVISVGNLSTGGTGKTPVVQWVCARLVDAGRRPVIAMRGYRAGPGRMGDEHAEHREALPEVPVVAQPDRTAGLRALFATPEGKRNDCVVLDDGFQHRKIARDLDIVLVDATAPPHRDALLPTGNLREPTASLGRADAIIITRAELVSQSAVEDLLARLGRQAPHAVLAVCRHAWTGVDEFAVGSGQRSHTEHHTERLAGAGVLAACGLGNPNGFFSMLESHGAKILERIALRDHARIGPRLAGRLASRADELGCRAVCMTRKDWVKARRCWPGDIGPPVWVPRLGVRVEQGERALADAVGAAVANS